MARKNFSANSSRPRCALRMLALLSLCAAAANAQLTQSFHRVNITLSASGDYTANTGGVYLTGTGEVLAVLPGYGSIPMLPNAKVNAVIHVNQGVCNLDDIDFVSTVTLTELIGGVDIWAGLASLTENSPNQACQIGMTAAAIPNGFAYATAGQLSSNGTETTNVVSGIFNYLLVAAHQYSAAGASGTWTLTGHGELGLLTVSLPKSGASAYPAVAGPGGSGYPLVSNGADGGTAVVFDSGSSETPSDRKASGGSQSLQIILPPQPVAANYSVSATCYNAPTDCWVTIPEASGLIPAASGATVAVNVSAKGLDPGVYPANVAMTVTPASGQNGQNPTPVLSQVPLTAIVTAGGPVLGLSQTGLQFQAVTGLGTPGPESISVTNQGNGSLAFSATPITASGGSWLKVNGGTGSTTSSAPTTLNITADPSGLAPGVYFGRVDFAAQGALNAPQSIEVVLNVLSASAVTSSLPAFYPAGLTFIAAANTTPAAQSLQISNPSNQPVDLTLAPPASASAPSWLQASLASGTATSSQPLVESVSVNTAGLAVGVYNSALTFQDSAGNFYAVPVQLIVPQSAPCTPTQLLPMFTNIGDGFEQTAGLPVALHAQIFDDCGSPLTSGSVVASFSSGDPSVSMTSIGNGQWSGTWMPGELAGGIASVNVTALSSIAGGLQGSANASGSLDPNTAVPFVSLGGVVSAASLASNTPVAPGSYVSIFGSNLAAAPTSAASLPLQKMLGNVQILLGGLPLPLDFVGPNQINAIVPAGTPVNTLQQLIVIQNGVYSLPQTLVVAGAQPAVFTQNQSGSGAGAIEVVKSDGSQFLNTPSTPAVAGDALVIYCAGLGAVSPPVPDGTPAPSTPLSKTVNPVTVTIGGRQAEVLYAGLAPGYAGLYQVNVVVPSGISPAANVPVFLSVAGQVSPPVTVALQ